LTGFIAGRETGTPTIDRLPAFNAAPQEVTGAGDTLFTCASLALAHGADIWHSAYLGSFAAAYQVSRVGNHPIFISDLLSEIEP
jgi:bifunctional ADP-heptose synthase (sugar kinase/adenylyltransferase)